MRGNLQVVAAFRERKEVRSFRKLRKSNSGRVLNLISLSEAAALRDPTGRELSLQKLFHCHALNHAILTKHNIREYERDAFAPSLLVATKVFIPFDPKRLDSGGRSFFIEEYQFREYLKELLHFDLSGNDPHVQHDLQVLWALSRSPTLDPFIITECLRSEGLRVEPALFSESYAVLEKASAEVFEVFKPLVQKAIGKSASKDELSRFVNQVWNVSTATTNNLFLEALQVPKSQWANVIFAWKALIYYDLMSRGSGKKLQQVLHLLQGVVFKSRPAAALSVHVGELKRELARSLYKLHDGSTGYIQQALKNVVNAILGGDGAAAPSKTLRNMADHISGVGMNVVLFDQVTSYLFYLYPHPTKNVVDAEEFAGELANLCAIVQLRDKGFGG